MYIERLDQVVLTVRDIDATIAFYRDVLGMQTVSLGDGRRALAFGQQKINLRAAAAPLAPHAQHPTRGSADLCFISTTPLREVVSQLERLGIAIEAGPGSRSGAPESIESVCFRDPVGNLLEVSNDPR